MVYDWGESKRGGMAELASVPRPMAFFDDDAIAAWLIRHEGRALTLPEIIGGLADRLLGEGVPLWRVGAGVMTVHPEVRARGVFWRRGERAVEQTRPHGIELSGMYLDNPVAQIHQGAGALRRRLDGPHARLDFPLMAELK